MASKNLGGTFQPSSHSTSSVPPAPPPVSQPSQGKRSTTVATTYSNVTPQSSKGTRSGHSSGYHHHGGDLMSPPGQGTPHHSKDLAGPSLAISDFETVDSSRNPLHCLICNNVFDDPRLLACYHSFCAKCLDGRLGDTKVICPLCGKVTTLKEGSGPAPDFLLRYLLHTTSDLQPSCANCDNKGRIAMFYCNTCGQVLCNGCREETHRAKMFSAHDIIPVSRYTKETQKKCSVHGEQFIMFSTARKTMLCINCYRDEEMQARLHCVDLDTAYSQGCRKLDRAVMSLRDLQVAVRDGITMLKNVLEELRRNADSEKSAVSAVCQTILDALTKTQENLLRDVDCQSDVKDKVIRGQLSQLRAVLPTIKLHLTMCASISNSASKYDFLDLAYPLIDRLTAITHMGYPIRPGQSSQIKSSYKSEIARTLEPWIAGTQGGLTSAPLSSTSSTQLPKDYTHPSINLTSVDPTTFTEPTYSQYYPMSRSTVTPHHTSVPPPPIPPPKTPTYAPPSSSGRKTPTSSKSTKTAFDSVEEQFTAHCRSFNTFLNELNQRLARLKEQVQDLHRDVTLQRGAAYIQRTEAALCEGLILEEQLNRRQAEMERIKKLLETSWNEHMRVVRIEQEVFQTQMNDLMSLKVEVKQLSSILQQLQSFLRTVEAHQIQQQQQQQGPPSGGGAQGPPGGTGQGSTSLPRQQGQSQGQTRHQQSGGGPEQQQQGLRMESSSQVTTSLTEVGFNVKGGSGPRGKKETPTSLSQKSSELVSRLGRFSISKVSSGGSGSAGGAFMPPVPSTTGQGSSSGSSIITPAGTKPSETEYIQVDTSFPPPSLSHAAHKRGILNQLIDKVRLKDDRKKSTSSSVSGSSGTPAIPSTTAAAMSLAAATSAVAASNRAAARAAMYDAQVQYGNYPHFMDKSAVTALRKASSARIPRGGRGGSISSASAVSSRGGGEYRGKPFVKSKSDDERPPTKLSRESRARSVAAMDPESLLRSLSSSKEAARILSLYRNLLQDKECRGPAPFYPPYNSGQRTLPESGQRTPGTASIGRSRSGSRHRRTEPNYLSEDDYQQITFVRGEPPAPPPRGPPPVHQHVLANGRRQSQLHGLAGSTSSSYYPRQGSGSLGKSSASTSSAATAGGQTHVKVFVHPEPSGHQGPLSKSLEEQYLFGFISDIEAAGGAHPHLKKPISVESLISLSSGGGGGNENSRKSSIDFDRRSVVTVRRAGSKNDSNSNTAGLGGMVRQHSWEAGLSSARSSSNISPLPSPGTQRSLKAPSSSSTPMLSPELGIEDDEFARSSSSSGRRCGGGAFDDSVLPLRKADSFEGHEEAVRSLVAAVQETRTLQRNRTLQQN